jgi:predicted small integral membrane protein
MTVRLCKAVLVALIGAFALLVGYNNIADIGANYAFVQHVLTMDTTFPGGALHERAITDPALHRMGYVAIVAGELMVGGLCLAGAARLMRALRLPAAEFRRAKALAILGLVAGFVLWFAGFMTVGAEWFLMWQSPTWNGQQAAFRFIACIGLVLVFVNQPDD